MFIPRWVTLLVAAMVITFGVYRLYVSFTDNDEKRAKRKGLYAMSGRRHGLFGLLYLILGAFLIANAFGFNPFR